MSGEIKNARIDELIGEIGSDVVERELITALRERGMTISCAESCTGGLIAKRLTDIAGASEVFFGGAVTYVDEAKIRLLGVRSETLEKHTAVSEQTAAEMARGIRLSLRTDIGISTTGYAGPTGGTDDMPVGTVFVGVSFAGGESVTRLSLSEYGSRSKIREAAASQAMLLTLKLVKGTN